MLIKYTGKYVNIYFNMKITFPGFDLVFLFHLLDQVALALVTFLSFLFCHFCFSFLPFRLDLSALGLVLTFQSSLLCFCSDLLFLFSSGFPASTWFRCASQVLFFILI